MLGHAEPLPEADPLLSSLTQPQRWTRPRIVGAAVACAAVLAVTASAVFRAPPPPPPVAKDLIDAAAGSAGSAGSSASSVRLRIINGCASDAIWIANFAFQAPFFPQDIKVAAGAAHDFQIPDAGLAATRFWPKWGCGESGTACKIGESGGPGESCGPDGCAPPVDSKFEATFGCMRGVKEHDCAVNPSLPSEHLDATDWWDVSQVDGWTLPYKVALHGDCPGAPSSIDCSDLALSACPTAEDLGLPTGPESLKLADPKGGDQPVGCYAPCSKLTFSQWGQGHGYTAESAEAQDYCCPTPPISPQQCAAGPVEKTKYVEAVHKLCPKVYAYSYDDGVGLAKCPSGVRYDVTFFCPK